MRKGQKLTEEVKKQRDEKFLKTHGITYSDFMREIASRGGKVPHPETRPFRVGSDLAKRAGTLGGLNRRGWRKDKNGQ